MLDIQDRIQMVSILRNIEVSAKPIFGSMTPQHMIEHLASSLQLSSGKRVMQVLVPEEKAIENKRFLYSDNEFRPGITTGNTPVLKPLRQPDIDTAVKSLFNEINDFNIFYKTDKSIKTKHPWFGALDYFEWSSFHNKHFKHHFRQFNLL